LLYESKLYKFLQGGIGIPNVYWFGVEGDYNVMVMDILGQSLEELFNTCKKKFSYKTTLLLADQMVISSCALFRYNELNIFTLRISCIEM